MKAFLVFSAVLVTVSSSVIIDNVMYFANTDETFTHQEAHDYCASEGGELAKIYNNALFQQVLRALPEDGGYFINGKDRLDSSRFELSQTCSWDRQPLDYSGVPPSNLALDRSVSCLSLERGATAKASQIATSPCNLKKYALCEFPVNGCDIQ